MHANSVSSRQIEPIAFERHPSNDIASLSFTYDGGPKVIVVLSRENRRFFYGRRERIRLMCWRYLGGIGNTPYVCHAVVIRGPVTWRASRITEWRARERASSPRFIRANGRGCEPSLAGLEVTDRQPRHLHIRQTDDARRGAPRARARTFLYRRTRENARALWTDVRGASVASCRATDRSALRRDKGRRCALSAIFASSSRLLFP